MSKRRLVASIAAAITAGALAVAVGPSGQAQATDPALPRAGHLQVGAASHVVLRNLPSTRTVGRASSHPALMRNGKPTGSNLPSRPSVGRKPAAKSAVVTPHVITSQFNGVDAASSSCGCQPPDVNAAIGPTEIVETVNLSLAVYTKTGTLVQNTPLSTFLNTADGLSDPRVVYDSTWDRWEISLTDTSTPSLWLVYSGSNDPLGGWWFYHVGFGFAAGSIVDYPMVGMDQDAFVYSSNNFDPSENYINSTVFALPKARVYNGFGWSAFLFGVNFNTEPAIVAGHPIATDSKLFLLSPDDTNNVMDVYYLDRTSTTPTFRFKGAIAYNWAAPSRRVNQPGTTTTLDPLDGRIDWAVSQLNGRLWFAHGVAIGTFPGINWGYVRPANMSIHFNTAFHSATSDDFNPSIAAEVNTATGNTQEVLSWAYTDTANNVPTTDLYQVHVTTALTHVGGTTFSGGGGITSETRFGDYSSVAPEYNANGTCAEGTTALVTNQYFDPSGQWRTRLARVHGTC